MSGRCAHTVYLPSKRSLSLSDTFVCRFTYMGEFIQISLTELFSWQQAIADKPATEILDTSYAIYANP